MDGNTTREFTRLWSQVPHLHLSLHGIVPHVHDISLSALAAATGMLGIVILLELRSVVRLRQVVDGSLARVFEQLDLLRFESQQLLEEQQSLAARPRVHARSPAAPAAPVAPASPASPVSSSVARARTMSVTPATPTASPSTASPTRTSGAIPQPILPAVRIDDLLAGAPNRELAERRGLSSGEARLLSSLAEARARRAAASEPVRA